VQLPTVADVEARLLGLEPGAVARVERLQDELPQDEADVLLGLPISVYGGG